MIKMKKAVVFLLIIMLFLMAGGCASISEKGESAQTETEKPKPTQKVEAATEVSLAEDAKLEIAIDFAADVFEGVCLEKTLYEPLGEADMSVRVERVFRGSVKEGDVVNVIGDVFDFFSEGCSYVFMTEKYASVYRNKPLMYHAGTAISITESGICKCILPDVDGKSKDEIETRISEYVAAHKYPGNENEVMGEYCTSNDIEDIIAYSDSIAVVKAESVASNVGDRTCYNCTIVSVYKGEMPDRAVIAAFKNGMEPETEYLVLLNAGSEAYLLSSAKSLIENGTKEAKEVLDLLAAE